MRRALAWLGLSLWIGLFCLILAYLVYMSPFGVLIGIGVAGLALFGLWSADELGRGK